jgi:hypothetical protein
MLRWHVAVDQRSVQTNMKFFCLSRLKYKRLQYFGVF